MPDIAIILIAYNRFATTQRCIHSLMKVSDPAFDIIVVDNDSNDRSGQRLAVEFPQVKLIQNTHNRGFCGGNNDGIRFAQDQGYKFILLLNDDVEVDPDFMLVLQQKALNLRGEFVLIGKIFCNHDRNVVWYAGGRISLLQGIGKHFGHFKADSPVYNIPRRVDYVTGCMLFAPAATFQKVGLLNEDIFAYLDDTEYSLRLKRANVPCYYVPESVIYHDVGAGTKLESFSTLYLEFSTRNRLLISTNPIYRLYLALYTGLLSCVKILLLIMKSGMIKPRAQCAAICRGYFRGLALITGLAKPVPFAKKPTGQ